jgi:predicted PurR-regulated permease PerM
MTRSEYVIRIFIALGIFALAGAVWMLSDLLLLLFGASLVAVLIRSVADPLQELTSIGPTPALVISVLAICALIGGSVALLGPALKQQMTELINQLPTAWTALSDRFQLGPISELLKDAGTSSLGTLATRMFSFGSTIVGAVASLALVVFGGLYIAAAPQSYRDGMISLVPMDLRPLARQTLDECGEGLRRWLSGQLVAMFIIGSLTGLGLWFAGVPSSLALGLIAGLFAFVPIFGPFLAFIPTLIMASSQGPTTLAWAAGVFLLVQQIEGNLITPLVAQKTVAVSPALGLFAVVAAGVLFGIPGLLMGFPLIVVADIAVRRLYVRETLDEPVEILGETATDSAAGKHPD